MPEPSRRTFAIADARWLLGLAWRARRFAGAAGSFRFDVLEPGRVLETSRTASTTVRQQVAELAADGIDLRRRVGD